jgi:hypothetical protein
LGLTVSGNSTCLQSADDPPLPTQERGGETPPPLWAQRFSPPQGGLPHPLPTPLRGGVPPSGARALR